MKLALTLLVACLANCVTACRWIAQLTIAAAVVLVFGVPAVFGACLALLGLGGAFLAYWSGRYIHAAATRVF